MAKGRKMAEPTDVRQPTNWFAGCAARANLLLVSLDDSQVGPAGLLAKQSLHIWRSDVDSAPHRVILSSVQGMKPHSGSGSVQMPLMYEVSSAPQE